MDGYIHSIESFGTVDGPGIRMVVFLQGCPLRCKYCHNPDTWKMSRTSSMSVQEILDQYDKNKYFYSSGGITVTGGEPLLQIDFLIELFAKAKEKNIHTCIDTSGATFKKSSESCLEKMDALMEYTDLVMLDIKHIDSAQHKELTGVGNEAVVDFARYLNYKKKPVWIRHVVIPTITEDEQQLRKLGCFLGELDNIKALDILPYHRMGISKYEELGLKYDLEDIPPATVQQAKIAKDIILDSFYEKRKKRKSAHE